MLCGQEMCTLPAAISYGKIPSVSSSGWIEWGILSGLLIASVDIQYNRTEMAMECWQVH